MGLQAGRHFDRSSRFVLALALALVLVSVVQKAYRFSLPTDGFSTAQSAETEVPVFQENLLGEPSALRQGDVFVAVNGLSHEALRQNASAFHRPVEVRAGETLRYTVLRDGRELTLAVPQSHWTIVGVARALRAGIFNGGLSTYTTWLAIVIAAFVYWQRPRNTTARLMLLFYTVELAVFISRLASPFSVADLLFPTAFWSALLAGHAIYGVLTAPLLLHLCLTFPTPQGFLQGRPWLLVGVYTLPSFLFLSDILSSSEWVVPVRPVLSYSVVALYTLLGVTALTNTFFSAKDPIRRAQVRWFAFGFAVSSLASLLWVANVFGLLPGPVAAGLSAFPSGLFLTLCLAVAVLRYRLFDIDLIINRTLVYGALTACVVGVYVLVVGGIGALFRTQSFVVSLLATGLVALLFHPLRERLQRFVNRLLYGERDEPYALLSKLSQQVEGTLVPEEVLPTILETITRALKLPYASVLFHYREGNAIIAEHGALSSQAVAFPLTYQGETFGEMRLGTRAADEAFSPAEARLLTTITQQVGVAAYAARQTVDLKRSRERLIAAREEERLRIRRDLHDGIGPTLAGLGLQASSLKHLLRNDPGAAEEAIDELKAELGRAAGEIRQLVHDLRPPSLDQLGLLEALKQLVETLSADGNGFAQPTISLELPAAADLPAATEVALYRIVQEALTNAVKHARARHIVVRLRVDDAVSLTIRDDGLGLPDVPRAGVGLHSMRERAEELGGTFEIGSRAGQGAKVCASLPLHRS